MVYASFGDAFGAFFFGLEQTILLLGEMATVADGLAGEHVVLAVGLVLLVAAVISAVVCSAAILTAELHLLWKWMMRYDLLGETGLAET